MAPLAIGTIIQTPTIPCTQPAHKSRPYLLQGQENMASDAKLTLMGESVALRRILTACGCLKRENTNAAAQVGRFIRNTCEARCVKFYCIRT